EVRGESLIRVLLRRRAPARRKAWSMGSIASVQKRETREAEFLVTVISCDRQHRRVRCGICEVRFRACRVGAPRQGGGEHHDFAPRAWSIACLNALASAPCTRRPFTKKVGVPFTPTAAASAWSALTASIDFRPCMHSFSFGTSRPAAVAISSTLAGRLSLLSSFCFAKRPL